MDSEPLEDQSAAVLEWRRQTLSPAVESAHPYSDDANVERRIEGPSGSIALKLRMRIRTESGYDYVEFLDGNRNVVQSVSGSSSGLTREIPGSVAIVRLSSDGSVTDWGFSVTELEYKIDTTPPPSGNGQWVENAVTGVETAHPYTNDTDKSWTITAAAQAQKLRLQFTGFETERDYDFVRILDGSGREVSKLHGSLGSFTSAEISGNTARIRFTSDYSVTARGFAIPKYEAFVPSQGGCTSDRDCRSDEACTPVVCIRAPCPSQCVPRPSVEPGDAAEACDARSAPCASGLVCRAEQNSASGGVCVAPAWSREALPVARSTNHPYRNGEDVHFNVNGPTWAQRIGVVFSDFETESGYDFAVVEAGGRVHSRFDGNRGDFETSEITGSSALVHFTSDDSVTGYGFDISSVDAYGVPDRLVAVSLDPRQCSSDRLPTDSAGLVRHLEGLGVAVYGLRRYTYTTQVCAACSCPTGERIVLVVNAKDAAKVKGLTRTTGVYSVQRGDVVYADALTGLKITPKQCRSNAWDSYCEAAGRTACGSTEESRVQAWAGSLGVNVYAIDVPTVREVVCLACSCPTAYDVWVAVPSAQASVLSARGFGP